MDMKVLEPMLKLPRNQKYCALCGQRIVIEKEQKHQSRPGCLVRRTIRQLFNDGYEMCGTAIEGKLLQECGAPVRIAPGRVELEPIPNDAKQRVREVAGECYFVPPFALRAVRVLAGLQLKPVVRRQALRRMLKEPVLIDAIESIGLLEEHKLKRAKFVRAIARDAPST